MMKENVEVGLFLKREKPLSNEGIIKVHQNLHQKVPQNLHHILCHLKKIKW